MRGVIYSEPARTTIYRTRIRWTRVAGLLVVVAALAAALSHGLPAASSATVAAPIDALRGELRDLRREHGGGALGEADGAVPDGTTVFDDGVPGVANLDPGLLGALRRAATDAATVGVAFGVDSGWRSEAYQQQLLDDAISKYGSEQEAARWVATPDTSAHVSGDAVDVGPSDAAAWLSRARRRVRAVPDLRQRALALRTAPRGRRPGLPADVRRPDERSEDATVTQRRLRLLATLAVAALIGAGCGSNPPPRPAPPAAPAAAAAPAALAPAPVPRAAPAGRR